MDNFLTVLSHEIPRWSFSLDQLFFFSWFLYVQQTKIHTQLGHSDLVSRKNLNGNFSTKGSVFY